MSRGKRRLLIVDDEVDLVEMLALRFEASGAFEVDKAFDGDDGMAHAKAFKPDIVLLDSVMPKMDGWQLCRTLRADPDTNKAKIVIMTAGNRSEASAKEAGADSLVLKPYDYADLLGVLRAL